MLQFTVIVVHFYYGVLLYTNTYLNINKINKIDLFMLEIDI